MALVTACSIADVDTITQRVLEVRVSDNKMQDVNKTAVELF